MSEKQFLIEPFNLEVLHKQCYIQKISSMQLEGIFLYYYIYVIYTRQNQVVVSIWPVMYSNSRLDITIYLMSVCVSHPLCVIHICSIH